MSATSGKVTIGALGEHDVPAADAVFRLAFGTMLGLPEPQRFAEGAELVRTRWRTDPDAAVKAEAGGELVGCAFVTRWGSYAVFGPIAVRPDYWDGGVGQELWEAFPPLFERWGVTHVALFTRVEPKNVHLYRKFGFWPAALTALTSRQLDAAPHAASGSTFAGLPAGEREGALQECRRVAGTLLEGLDVGREILSVDAQGLGDTILLADGGGFAVCHAGEGSEAGPGACYVKFAAVPPGEAASFEQLLDEVEAYARERALERVVAGVSLGREEAARALFARGYRTLAFGVAMHRPGGPSWDRPGAFVLDDRR